MTHISYARLYKLDRNTSIINQSVMSTGSSGHPNPQTGPTAGQAVHHPFESARAEADPRRIDQQYETQHGTGVPQSGQVLDSTGGMPAHNIGAAVQPSGNVQPGTTGGGVDSYGTTSAGIGAQQQAFATQPIIGTNAPATSYVDRSQAQHPVGAGVIGSGTAGAMGTGGPASDVTGGVKPTTGEKIRGTWRQTVGEFQGNPCKAAEGAALKEGTHPVQTGPYAASRNI